MKKARGLLVIKNDKGLHTRPTTELVRCASRFRSHVKLRYKKNEVNAKSILGVLGLAACKGSKITVEAEGEDADQVIEELLKLASDNFHMHY